MKDTIHMLVDRSDITRVRVEYTPTLDPARGEILVRVSRLALTTNSITYAVVSDRIPYFDFFPAPAGWGRLPLWGFGDVVASNASGIDPGERLYGFWPASTHVTLAPDRVSHRTFFDGAGHRRDLPAAYNSYSRVASDPTYRPQHEGLMAILRPLFLTSFTLDAVLAQANFYGAEQVVVSSASSKTAWALAHLLAARPDVDVIGLTAPTRRDFVEGLGIYSAVLAYDDIDALPRHPTVYVDLSGSAPVRSRLRATLGDLLRFDHAVGLTHWQAQGPPERWAGVDPVVFFAPAQFVRLLEQQDIAEFWSAYAAAWDGFISRAEGWVVLVETDGIDALAAAYRAFVAGDVDPRQGVVIRV